MEKQKENLTDSTAMELSPVLAEVLTPDLKRIKCMQEFNSMPFEHRSIAANSELIARIQDLEQYKKRLKLNYDKEIAWINETIKNYERGIGR